MKKFSINKSEAFALLIQIEKRGLNTEQAEALISSASYRAPFHTATVRRLAREIYASYAALLTENEKLMDERMAVEQSRRAALTPEQRNSEDAYGAEYRAICEATNKKNKRHKARRLLEAKYGFPAGSNGRW